MSLDTINATIFVTDKCNLACSYCYEPDKEYKEVSREDIRKFIRLLYETPEYSSRGKITLDFIGGEPLLVPDLIDYAIEIFFEEGKKRSHPWIKCGNFTLFLTTNGTLFGEEKVKNLLQKNPCLIVGMSLDGDKNSHDSNRRYLDGRGSYDKIMETFEWWKKRYKQDYVKGTLSRNNLGNLANMLYHQVELGMVQPWVNPVFEEVWTKEDAEIYKQQLESFIDRICNAGLDMTTSVNGFVKFKTEIESEENYCGSGKYMVTLGLEGKLYPCHRFATNVHKYSIGDTNNGLDNKKLDQLMEGFKKVRCKGCSQNGSCPVCYASFYDIHNGEFAPVVNICEIVVYGILEMGHVIFENSSTLD